ncbi:MAG: A24 family peptidase [Moraxella sp.]|nr:A24 family peptidase [Moraxella sp.]
MSDVQIILHILSSHQPLLIVLVGIIGLVMGSFINVVAHRTPLIMMHEWRQEVFNFIKHDDSIDADVKARLDSHHALDPISLSTPASHCPSCHARIRWWQNIPLLSYLLIKGRCTHCHGKISPMYPATEATTALLSMLIAHHFGASIQMLLALILVWYLLALSCIDWRTRLLPDRLLVPLGIIGLLANTASLFTTPLLSIWGLSVGFVAFWFINVLCKWLIRQDGLGLGDAKLLGVLGAWLGVSALPIIILVASLLGVVVGVIGKASGRSDDKTLAFGPYLVMGGVVALLFGERLWAWYLAGFY